MELCNDPELAQVKQKTFSDEEKPADRYVAMTGKEAPGKRGWTHSHRKHSDPHDDYEWGRLGHDPDEKIPPMLLEASQHIREARRLVGNLKRAWQYPAVMKRFRENPFRYFSVNEVMDTFEPLDIPAPKMGQTWLDYGRAVGVPAACLDPAQPKDSAARVVLFLIRLIHEKHMSNELDCK